MTSYNSRTDGLRTLNMSDTIQAGDRYFTTLTQLIDVPSYVIGLSIDKAREKMYPVGHKELTVYRFWQSVKICSENTNKIFVADKVLA